jgi:FKBP-type peptidyl-prolyl cis-trans isomerase
MLKQHLRHQHNRIHSRQHKKSFMKRNRHFLLLATVAILVVAFSSFTGGGDPQFKGYTPIENGSFFRVITKGAGTISADTGGAVFVKIKFLTENDSVFVDINESTHLASYPMRVDKSEFKGDFLDIFSKLHVGDSVSLFVRLDSLKKYYPNEFNFSEMGSGIDNMKYLGFNIKVDSIYNRKKVQELKAELEETNRKYEQIALQAKEEEPAAIAKYIRDNNIKTKPDATGLYYIETLKGKGNKIKTGQTITITYTCKYLNGEIFDESGAEPFSFVVGTNRVIPGLEKGVLQMRNGGKATIITPSSLAYGPGGGLTKPYATLIFDVRVVSVQDAPVIAPN